MKLFSIKVNVLLFLLLCFIVVTWSMFCTVEEKDTNNFILSNLNSSELYFDAKFHSGLDYIVKLDYNFEYEVKEDEFTFEVEKERLTKNINNVDVLSSRRFG